MDAVTQDLNSFGEIVAHAQCSVDEKKIYIYIYIPCVPHKINCKKNGSHDMKQTYSSIIIVRNVCVLTTASMIVYLFQVEICSQQLEICKSVCMFIDLAIVVETD
jgi:hypothetical protein